MRQVERELHIPKFYSATKYLDIGCLTSFTGCIFLVISYGSPYWLASWQDTRSPFLNLGLWTSCFYLFRHPKVQFDQLYHGCYSVWGDSLKMIAYWMVPGWMILIQVMTTLALITSITAQVVSVCLVLRSPLQVVLRFERRLMKVLMLLNLISAVFMSVSVTVFPLYCWRRDYLLYPNYNYLSWSYKAGLASILACLTSLGSLYQELGEVVNREDKNLAVLYQFYPKLNPSSNSFDLSSVTGNFI